MRFELELQAWTDTPAHLIALRDAMQQGMDSRRVDIDQAEQVINDIRTYWEDASDYLMTSFAGTTRTGLDQLFDFLVNELERPNRGVLPRSSMWLKQVGDDGRVNDQRNWPAP